jgi:hypothetical protein
VFDSIAGNEQGFAMLGNLKNVRPEPLMIEKLMMKITTKSQIDFRQAGTKAK